MLRLIVTATAIITSSSAIYIYVFHQRLSKRVNHTRHIGTLPRKPNIESIPDPIFTPEFFTVYDKCAKAAQRSAFPNESPDLLFTRFLRRNMIAFSHFPQALLLALVSKTPEEKGSFKKAYISALEFEVGDLVCGAYRVVRRRRDRVEFEIRTQGFEFVEGRLIISFDERENELVFCCETFMWRKADEARRMPMERWGIRWMHELAAWWLVDYGVKYLMDLE